MSQVSNWFGASRAARFAMIGWGLLAALGLSHGALAAEDPDEAELLKYYKNVDVWHAHIDYKVGYNDQDVIVTRELSPKPPTGDKLCYIRFDLLEASGDYAYGFRPQSQGGPRKDGEWGVFVGKRGTVLDQLRSTLSLNAIYFYVGEPRDEYKNAPPDICARKQAADTAQAGHGYKASQWSDLVTKGRLTHGWPSAAPH
jgi:hypothetical protein